MNESVEEARRLVRRLKMKQQQQQEETTESGRWVMAKALKWCTWLGWQKHMFRFTFVVRLVVLLNFSLSMPKSGIHLMPVGIQTRSLSLSLPFLPSFIYITHIWPIKIYGDLFLFILFHYTDIGVVMVQGGLFHEISSILLQTGHSIDGRMVIE